MTKKDVKSIPAAQIQMTGDPIVFDAPVKIKRLDGSVHEITLKLQVMRKSEWAKIRDGLAASVMADAAPAEEGEEKAPSNTGFYQQHFCEGFDRVAEVILKAAVGWSESESITVDALLDLEDRQAGALVEVLQAIDWALLKGKVGN